MLAARYGNISADCATSVDPWCYTPCEHTQYVLGFVGTGIAQEPFMDSLLRGILFVAEGTIEAYCNAELSLCALGERVGLSCIQCVIYQPAFPMCPPILYECGEVSWREIDPCYDFCAPVCQADCKKKTVDMTTDPLYTDLFSRLIDAIKTRPTANWAGIELALAAIFPLGSVVGFSGGKYLIDAGQTLTAAEKSAIDVILSVLPFPIGTTGVFVEAN